MIINDFFVSLKICYNKIKCALLIMQLILFYEI